ncbi:hypothetical protein [Brachyspira catarrhinii]|uniref:Hydrolase n=1 Tax=Brachyspira catarrhinii TaxID=2528966 RepID=A0ABY2TRI0_9SPIR|nr:hypothetical protein [Brachyspira catarrhinii]TKZ35482.1 hypothetical protein EZH24_05030 [Brachyspira catarrhinii]
MSIIDKIFNYSEDYRYKTWKIFGIKFSVVKKYNSKKINIYEEIKKHEIISFDIFDTLLIRPYVKPTDLFLHIEKLYKIKGFHKNRILAEKSARGKYIDKEEVTLNQIYEEIDEKYKPFKEIEIELEERILTIHKENKEIYDYVLSLGKKIIIASDMYLPKNVIEKILIKNNYTNYYKLYLSSDLMLTKASGNLYKYIIEDLKVEPSSIMHIGDNFHSDFNNPKLYGIDSVYIEKIIDTFLENNIRAKKLLNENKNNIGISIMLGISAFSCLNNFNKNENKENNYWRNFGFVYGGPAVFSYMNWLKKQIIKDNINEVLFVARDGYSLKKVFDLIKPESVKTHYIYAPRIIYYLITLDFDMHFKYYPIESFELIKSVIEYYKDKDEYLQKNTPKITSATQGYKFILSNIEIYKKLAKLEYQNYREYINSIDINGSKIAIVDTCSFFISSQRLVSLFLGKENIIGYYWYSLLKENQNYRIKSFQKIKKHLFIEWNLMEFFMTSPEPPIKNIVDSKPLYHIPNKYEEKRMDIYPYVSDGIVEFFKIAKNCFRELELFINYKEIVKWINMLACIPREYDKKYIKNIKHNWSVANNKYIPLIQRWFIKESGKKYYLFSFIPFLRKEKFTGGEIKYYLFSFIPIMKIKTIENKRKYYLFMIFNILTIK